MRAASTAAFFALSTPTHATGTPGGIWAIESSASSPPPTDIERIVERADRYFVIEKNPEVHGITEMTDPRNEE